MKLQGVAVIERETPGSKSPVRILSMEMNGGTMKSLALGGIDKRYELIRSVTLASPVVATL